MILKSFGDSFIFGTDLGDEVVELNKPIIASQQTWCAILAKKNGFEYQCFARPGAGNLQISEQILNQAADSQNSLFVISWSWIDRYDHWDSCPSWANGNQWRTICPTHTDDVANTYYKDLHSEYKDKLLSLMSIRLAIDTLIQKNIPFIMTYMDGLMFDAQWNMSLALAELQTYIKPYMITFEGKTFLDWSRGHGYAVSLNLHPLKQAHQAAADYMLNIFDKQKNIKVEK